MRIFPTKTQTLTAKKLVRTATGFGWLPRFFIGNTLLHAVPRDKSRPEG